jgi:hypothetical protein
MGGFQSRGMEQPYVMALELTKRGQKPEGCIFCGALPLTKEHFPGKWLREHFPAFQGTRFGHIMEQAVGKLGDKSVVPVSRWKGVLDRPGDFITTNLSLVCAKCNNGWMSAIQERAKPLLVPMLRCEWPADLTDAQRQQLAVWCAVCTICFEYADEAEVISAEERLYVKEHQKPPATWVIWLGELAPTHSWDGYVQRTWALDLPDHGTVHRGLSTCWVMDRLIVQVYSHTGWTIQEREPHVITERHGINVLWPPPGTQGFASPPKKLGNADTDDISHSLRPPDFPASEYCPQALKQP